jgi:hypothetical protein
MVYGYLEVVKFMSNKEIYNFLESKGFHLVKSENNKSFGDSFNVFTNDIFAIRFIKDRSITTIEVQSVLENNTNESWYDLALVKNLLHNETLLNQAITIEQYITFLKNNIDNIKTLFNRDNYSLTKNKIESLKNERAKQMFPQWN